MTEHVLFLAEGGTRKRAAAIDAVRVLDAGGEATLVVRDFAAWKNERLDKRIRVIDVDKLEKRYGWMRAEQALLVRGPRAAFRLVGLGPVKRLSQRAAGAWDRRVATPLHQRTFLPLLRRRPAARPPALIRQHLGSRAGVDLLVVTDPASMPAAVTFLQIFDVPRVAYNLDTAPAASMGER
ncbi:hypothetical protein AB0M54_02635 [Actinoplanes sp. NPDC051470]|uniref:hypothetical protein n=1 Tax=unclassified Actinoplanes TaxID=2626549 RepID=UPI003439019C